jgi:hypothetical protein
MLKIVYSIWYLVYSSWVKIVNNPRKLGSKLCDNSSTIGLHKQYKYIIRAVKVLLAKQFLLQPSTTKNTPNLHIINLLNKSFTHYPQNLLINLEKEI